MITLWSQLVKTAMGNVFILFSFILRQIISLHLSLHKKQNDRLNFKTNNKFTFRPYLVKTFGETQ